MHHNTWPEIPISRIPCPAHPSVCSQWRQARFSQPTPQPEALPSLQLMVFRSARGSKNLWLTFSTKYNIWQSLFLPAAPVFRAFGKGDTLAWKHYPASPHRGPTQHQANTGNTSRHGADRDPTQHYRQTLETLRSEMASWQGATTGCSWIGFRFFSHRKWLFKKDRRKQK